MSNDTNSINSINKHNEVGKLVKATELPVYGNPYPSKDVIMDETPNTIQLKISSVRNSLTPFMGPLVITFQKGCDVASIGSSHFRTTLQGLVETQNSIRNAAIISAMSLLGFGLGRRRGIFKKLLYGSTFASGTTAFLYPSEAGEKTQLLWYIATNKLPILAKQQYHKYIVADEVKDQVSKTTKLEK